MSQEEDPFLSNRSPVFYIAWCFIVLAPLWAKLLRGLGGGLTDYNNLDLALQIFGLALLCSLRQGR
jgi:hypothetical protein